MSVRRMDHVGVVVSDLDAAVGFFTELGLELQGRMSVEGEIVDRINGLEGVRSDIAMMRTPDGHSRLEVVKYNSPEYAGDNTPAPANTPGIRHLTFAVDDLEATLARLRTHGAELIGSVENYSNSYLLCYLRGPDGIIVELAEKLG